MNNERQIRLNMLISGTVQRVGYRHLIQGIARRHHITGCITNLEGYDVQIIAEGKPDDIARFKTDIRIQDYPVFVESIVVSEDPSTGEYSFFEITRGSPEEELAERFDTAIGIFSRMEKKQDISIDLGKETVALQKESLSLQKETLSLQKETITLQKETLSTQNESLSLQHDTISLQKDTISLQKETFDEVKGMRHDLNKTFTQEIAEVKEELREIRSALIQAGIMRSVHS